MFASTTATITTSTTATRHTPTTTTATTTATSATTTTSFPTAAASANSALSTPKSTLTLTSGYTMPSRPSNSKRPLVVPLLLEAFPVPPTHIPPTPTTPGSAGANPPPTGPPLAPLPPVPGPSRISEHEQLILLSSVAGSRSRRSSKYSTASSSAGAGGRSRESVLSASSARSRESVTSFGSAWSAEGGYASARTSVASLPPTTTTTSRESPTSSPSSKRTGLAPGPPPSSSRPVISISTAGAGPPTSTSTSSHSTSTSSAAASGSSNAPSSSGHAGWGSATRNTSGHGYGQVHIPPEGVHELHQHQYQQHQQLTRMTISPMPQLLSDIEDDDDDGGGGRRVPPFVLPSPARHQQQQNSFSSSLNSHDTRRGEKQTRTHTHPNESISEIDMRQVLSGVDGDGGEGDQSSLPPRQHAREGGERQHHHYHQKSLADPIDPDTMYGPLDSSLYANSTSASTSMSASGYHNSKFAPQTSTPANYNATTTRPLPPPTMMADSYFSGDAGLPSSLSTTTQFSEEDAFSPMTPGSAVSTTSGLTNEDSETSATRSPSIKDTRFGRRAERTRSEGLRRALNGRSRSRAAVAAREPLPEPAVGLPPLPGGGGASGSKGPLTLTVPGGGEGEEDGTTTPTTPVTPTVLDASPFASVRPKIGLGLPSDLGVIMVTKVVKTEVVEEERGEMTLDELGVREEDKERKQREEERERGRWPTKSRVIRRPATGTSISSASGSVDFPSSSRKERSVSPDIDTILSKTPRPNLSKSTSAASGSRAGENSRQRVKSHGSLPARKKMTTSVGMPKRRVMSEGILSSSMVVDSVPGYELERVLEGEGDSDSSLDLHTPLPHLMVRHGLLSPHSKLLPSREGTPLDPSGRPGSIMSVASNTSMMTKSGIMKDDRNTPMRRVRHRDGRLLRGGIGLTTGLGWSDSEDEDAPSPLTRRLSKLDLSRRSSASVIGRGSSRKTSHPLSRSVSSGALLETEREHRALMLSSSFDEYDEMREDDFLEDENDFDDDGQEDHTLQKSGEWAQRQRNRLPSRGPPTSRRSGTTRTSTSSLGSVERRSRGPPSTPNANASRDSMASNTSSSLALDTPVGIRKRTTAPTAPDDADMNNTPSSTASTVSSIPMPDTPKDLMDTTTSSRDKTLPPLPPGGLKKMPSSSRLAFSRPRTYSAASALSTPVSGATTTKTTTFTPSSNTPLSPKVRPLQLPRAAAARSGNGAGIGGGDRPAVPVPSPSFVPLSISTSNSNSSSSMSLASRSSLSSLRSPRSPPLGDSALSLAMTSNPALLTSSTSGIARPKPKPRTGTGMVYRSSSSSALGGGGVGGASLNSRMRVPSSVFAPSSISTSSSPAGGRMQRPIPL